jgi:hypothetical protein
VDQIKTFGYKNFEISEYQLGAMVELVNLARADGISIVMPSAPLNPLVGQIVKDHYASFDELWRFNVAKRSGITIAKIELGAPECDVWQKSFWDVSHVNTAGANSFSVALAVYLGGTDYHSTRTVRILPEHE